MAESYPIAFPTTKGPETIEMSMQDVVAVAESPLTLSTQTVRFAGQAFSATITVPPMDRDEASEWIGFMARLRGMSGTFLMGDPMAATARGSASTAAGTPVVKGASQTGYTLEMDGAPASATGYLLVGDYIQLGSGATSRLHMVVQDANSDGSGNVSLNIWPDLRSSPSDNATIVVANAKGVFRRMSNTFPWSVNSASIYGMTFSVREVI